MTLTEEEENVIVERNQVLARCNVCHKQFGMYKPICKPCKEEYKRNKELLKKIQEKPEAKQTTLLEV